MAGIKVRQAGAFGTPTVKVREAGAWKTVPASQTKARVAGAWKAVAPPVEAPVESLFTNQIPASLDNSDSGTIYTMGTLMKFAVPGRVLGIRWYAPQIAVTVTPRGLLYRYDGELNGTLLAAKDFGPITYGAGWTQILFDAPVNVDADPTWYIPAVLTNRYTATPGLLSNAIVNGNVASLANGGGHANGRYAVASVDSTAYPTEQFGAASYFVDVLFQAS